MATARFRLWFGTASASEAQLARIEEVEVTQEMDRFWEARLRLAVCLDAQGRWQHRPDEEAPALSRLRVEVDIGDGAFVPLIDGAIAGVEAQLDSQPGRSTTTFVVRDDSVFLNRDEASEVFENRRDSEVADELFRRFEQIADTRVDPPTAATHPTTTQRGTALALLAQLARANNRHAYVLPGDEPGRSIGCFLEDPQDPATLPPLVLLGDARNLAEATIEEDAEAPERTRGQTLRLADGNLASFETSASDLGLLRDRPAVPEDLTPLRQLPPAEALREDPEAAATSRAHDAGFAYRLAGRVIPGCYRAVLQPYQKVQVDAGATPYSGEYLITKVVHRITPSLYSQSLEAKSDSRTEVPAAAVSELPGGGLSVSFSASVGVF